MDDREKLVELLYTILPPAPATVTGIEAHKKQIDASYVADYLIYNGVTVREPGEWEWNRQQQHWECSRCGCIRAHDLVLGLDASFCGKCGAPMKGESNETLV